MVGLYSIAFGFVSVRMERIEMGAYPLDWLEILVEVI